jgi:hypothetical protein
MAAWYEARRCWPDSLVACVHVQQCSHFLPALFAADLIAQTPLEPTLEGPDMSDLKKTTEARKSERESSYGVDKRKLKALEDIADALEGIRQDLSGLPEALAETLQRVLAK